MIRRTYGYLMLAGLVLSGAACKIGGSSGQDQSATDQPAPPPPPPPPDPGPASGGDVVRYQGLEAPDSGPAYVRQTVAARKAADWVSPVVATLYPGTGVQKVARYGNYTLVSFTVQNATVEGWVDAVAWR